MASREPQAGPQDHGGNRRDALRRFGVDRVIDFSASINPLGHPEGLAEWIASRWDEVLHYPDRGAPELARGLAERYGADEESLLVGNGSAELIDLVFRALRPRRVLACPPDFGLYRELLPEGTATLSVPRIEAGGFRPDLPALEAALAPGDLAILSNPGNPSGCLAPAAALAELADRCAAAGATLVLDEAFADFCPGESLLPVAPRHPGLVVLRSLTKFFGIPGLRLGFAVGARGAVEAARALQVPWSVNALAQVAGVYCLETPGWEERTRRYVDEARTRLAAELLELPGVTPLASETNYLLLRLSAPAPSARRLYEELASRGVLVRHCGSFGLGERYVRVAVRTFEENGVLLGALREVLGDGGLRTAGGD